MTLSDCLLYFYIYQTCARLLLVLFIYCMISGFVFKELYMFLVLMHLIKTLKVELRSLRSKKRLTVVLISDLLHSAGKNHEISQQEKTVSFP